MPKFKYYVVYPANDEYETGIYRDYWLAAEATSGNPGDNGNRKGFNSWEEASQHYLARAGQLPYCVDWHDISAAKIDYENVEIKPGDNNHLKVTVTVSRPRTQEEQSPTGYRIDTSAIGQWGERFAYLSLVARTIKKHDTVTLEGETLEDGVAIFKERTKLAEIHWHNAKAESNKSPDITVVENEDVSYWEVKATSSDDKYNVRLTKVEEQFSKDTGTHYHLLRVIRAGQSNAEIYDFGNPFISEIRAERDDQLENHSFQGERDGYSEYRNLRGKIISRVHVKVSGRGSGRVFISRRIKRKIRLKFFYLESEHRYKAALEPLKRMKAVDVSIYIRGDVNQQAIYEALNQAVSKNP